MKDLFNLLERFSKSLNKGKHTKEVISQVIFERALVTLSPEDISLKEGVLMIQASAVAKNEISLKESTIKGDLKEKHHLPISRIIYK